MNQIYQTRCRDICNVDNILRNPSTTLLQRNALRNYLSLKSIERSFLARELIARQFYLHESKLFIDMIARGVSIDTTSGSERQYGFSVGHDTELSADELSLCARAVSVTGELLSFSTAEYEKKMKRKVKAIFDLHAAARSSPKELEGLFPMIRAKVMYEAQKKYPYEGSALNLNMNQETSELLEFTMYLDGSSLFEDIRNAWRSFKEGFKEWEFETQAIDVSLLEGRIQALEDWLEKVNAFIDAFNANIDIKKFTICYEKTFGNKNLSKSERERHGLVFEPAEYEKIDVSKPLYDDWIPRYIQELARAKKERATVSDEMEVALPDANERGSHSYHDHVDRWFQPERDPFAEDEKYAHISSDAVKNKIRLFHTFATAADPIVLCEGISEEVQNAEAGSKSRKYVLPCEIETREQLFRGFVGYCVDENTDTIWHRCFTQRSQGELLDDLFQRKFFDFDYPQLGSQGDLTGFVATQTPPTMDDGSFVDKQKSRRAVIVIEDPKHQATIRLIRAV
ncbi:MAG: hypothetical protein JSR46_04320 [Verrucomicrobia bacterium]|nr:hypothetical protein [Verrucomicrobiota bacterium]